MTKATVDDLDVSGRRVLLRVDFNVPMRDGRIADDRRIRASWPTIAALRDRGARVIIVTHFGRPKGKPNPEFSTAPLAARLGEIMGLVIPVAGDVVGESAQAMIAGLQDGDVGMLENVRFEPGEEANDPAFAQALASLADLYVNDAFGAAHRAHASTEGVAHILPAAAGRLMARELEVLGSVLTNPAPPLVAVIGGAKISTKLAVLANLIDRVDALWVGGAMASTFYRAQGRTTGRSLVEEDQIDIARSLLDSPQARSGVLRLPLDVVVAASPEAGAATAVVAADAIPDDRMVVDVGPQTCERIAADAAQAGTVVWNGPLGIYEIDEFAQGTRAVAHAVAGSPAFTVIGGGDVAAAVEDAGVADKIDHISTGGGATIEFLEGRVLPGVAALSDRDAVRDGAGAART
jgi:phosphoglycerate kinase